VGSGLSPKKLIDEDPREPPLIPFGLPASVDNEQAVDLGRHESMDDVGGIALSQLGPQRAGASQRTRDQPLAFLPLAGQVIE
jgi:hypothetical protein